MGCDIHSFAETRNTKTGKWGKVTDAFTSDYHPKTQNKSDYPFDWRSYGLFGFLADVRNYSYCKPISKRKGMPNDASDDVMREWRKWEGDGHSASFLTLKELAEFDYSKTFWDRRITRTTVAPNGAMSSDESAKAEEEEGEIVSYKDFLGISFFEHLEELKALGEPENVRIVFWFDS